MHLIIPDNDISSCVLTGCGAGDGSLAGASFYLPPLDIVFGDILSFFFTKDEVGEMHPYDDESWKRAIFACPFYTQIAASAYDAEALNDKKKTSETTLSVLESFLNVSETQRTFANFELYLIATETTLPVPQKNIVPRGFSSPFAESKECVAAHYALAESTHDPSKYISLWDKNREFLSIESTYSVTGFSDLALVSALILLQSGKTFVRCKNCGCFFSPSRAGEIYCSRIAPGKKKQTCKDAAKYEKQLARERASESGKIYKSVYNVLRRRYIDEANSERQELYRLDFYNFMNQAATFKEQVKRNEKTEDEYIDFLGSFRLRRSK